MSTWSEEAIRKIAETDDLHISPLREDGRTYGTPTWIWSVVVDGNAFLEDGQSVRVVGDGSSGRTPE